MVFRAPPPRTILLALVILLTACTAAAPATAPPPTVEPTQAESAPSATPQPTAAPASPTPLPASPTPEPDPTAVPELEGEPEPVVPVGSTASLTDTEDYLGIQGEVEVVSATQIVIRDFVYLAAEAPGVDIRLGVGDNFSDEVALSLADITGRTYEGRSLNLIIPASASGRTFDSIAVFCFATGDLFDYAEFNPPE